MKLEDFPYFKLDESLSTLLIDRSEIPKKEVSQLYRSEIPHQNYF